MAVNSKKDRHEGPGGMQNAEEKDHEAASSKPLTNKQISQRAFYARKKQKMISKEEEVDALKKTCAHTQGQLQEAKEILKEVTDQTSSKQERQLETIQQAVTEVGKTAEKQCALTFELWKLIDKQKDSAGTRDWSSIFASSEVLEVFSDPMAISAMRPKGLGMIGPFIPCQSVHPAFNKLKEQDTASEALLTQEIAQDMAATAARHAQETAATAARHAQEMAAIVARQAQEMAAVRAGYGRESNNKQELIGPSDEFDTDVFFTAPVRAGYGGESNNDQELAGPSRNFDTDDGDTRGY